MRTGRCWINPWDGCSGRGRPGPREVYRARDVAGAGVLDDREALRDPTRRRSTQRPVSPTEIETAQRAEGGVRPIGGPGVLPLVRGGAV